MYNHFSQPVSVFHGRSISESGVTLAGYAALIEAYALNVPWMSARRLKSFMLKFLMFILDELLV